jgi:hypothetical protein
MPPKVEKRRFPPPWQVVAINDECLTVQDASGQILCHLYFEDESIRRGVTRRLTSDEARRIASNIAKLPDLLRK